MSDAGPQLVIASEIGVTNEIASITNLGQTNWSVLTNKIVTQSPYVFTDTVNQVGSQRFYRATARGSSTNSTPPGMALIPAGIFEMGDDFDEGTQDQLPIQNWCTSALFSWTNTR